MSRLTTAQRPHRLGPPALRASGGRPIRGMCALGVGALGTSNKERRNATTPHRATRQTGLYIQSNHPQEVVGTGRPAIQQQCPSTLQIWDGRDLVQELLMFGCNDPQFLLGIRWVTQRCAKPFQTQLVLWPVRSSPHPGAGVGLSCHLLLENVAHLRTHSPPVPHFGFPANPFPTWSGS